MSARDEAKNGEDCFHIKGVGRVFRRQRNNSVIVVEGNKIGSRRASSS
jgi:hypothetical protein